MNSKKPLSIIGAGGHTRAVIDLLMDNDMYADGFYDNSVESNEEIMGIKGYEIKNLPQSTDLILAIGDNQKRKTLYEKYESRIHQPPIIHNGAYVNNTVIIKNCSLIFNGVLINTNAIIGTNTIVNSKATIEHESIIKNHSHISVGSIICGRVKIGNNCFIGAGAIVKDGISICDNVTIGAGAVVVKNIKSPGTYIGNPAKQLQ